MNETTRENLPRALLALRLGIFIAMAIWVIDKFLRPEHAAQVFEHFYRIGGVGTAVVYTLGAVQGLILLGFVAGLAKRLSYGLVLLMHAITTVVSYANYLHPFEGANILFFAAWPMLAAAWALYLLRDEDRLLTVGA